MGVGNLIDGLGIKLEMCLFIIILLSPPVKRLFPIFQPLQPTDILGNMVFGDQSWTC